jgi:tetratricopeptide (TPR) repeat protein
MRRLAAAGAILVMSVYTVATIRQQNVWQSTESFWTRIVQVEPLAITYKERGRYYHSVGHYAEAVADFTAALGMIPPTLKPYEFNFYAFRGESLRAAGHYDDALRDLTRAIEIRPLPVYFYHRGLALKSLGRISEANEDFRRAGPSPGEIGWFDQVTQ